MAPDWQRINDGVAGAAALEAEARAEWLDRFCSGDTELRREIESLLSFDKRSGFLDEALCDRDVAAVLEEETFPAETRFGNYRVISELGRGGMGTVYLAERVDGEYEKRVALKVIRQTILEKDVIERFRRERQILAGLDHPNIARLLDGGVSDAGEPYIVMEYVEGRSLLDFISGRSLDVRARLELFLGICSAVSYAHRNLIVHRDLKPSNIIVTKDGTPKLLDFGLAKAIDSGADITVTALRAMTPAYASPEQLRGLQVTTSSDVYSLGILLYEVLTGAHPYGDKCRTSWEDVLLKATTGKPPRPSSVPEARRLGVSSEIDNIVLTAMRFEPERRYASAHELADDIERYLDGRPVAARPNTFAYVASKFVARNRVAVIAAALVLAAILGGLFISLRQAKLAREERDRAQAERLKAERISQVLAAALAYSDPTAAFNGTRNRRDATINEMLDDLAPRLATELSDEPESRAALERTVGAAYGSQGRLREAQHYLNSALQTDIALYGEDHEETALTLAELADLKASAEGDYNTAEQMMMQAAAVYHRHPPTQEVHVRAFAGLLSDLGATRWTRADYSGADEAYSEAAQVAAVLTGEARQSCAEARAGLGLTRYAEGRLDEAVSLFEEAVTELRSIPTAKWRLPDALNGLGQSQMWSGRYDEALSSIRESAGISLQITGEENSNYARSLYMESYALCLSGKGAGAEVLIERSAAIYEKLSPDNALNQANIADVRALCLAPKGRAPEAEQFARKAIELYMSQLPAGSPAVTLARIHLGDALVAERKFTSAEEVFRTAYDDASAAQGKDHWRSKYAADRLAAFYTSRGRDDLAANYR